MRRNRLEPFATRVSALSASGKTLAHARVYPRPGAGIGNGRKRMRLSLKNLFDLLVSYPFRLTLLMTAKDSDSFPFPSYAALERANN